MPNSHKGEVAFEAGGEARTLRFDTNTICILEEDLDLGIAEIAARLDSGRLSVVRATIRAALSGGGAEVNLRQAGDIIDEIGHLRAVELLSQALTLAFPPPPEEGARPPKGSKAGTGKPSS